MLSVDLLYIPYIHCCVYTIYLDVIALMMMIQHEPCKSSAELSCRSFSFLRQVFIDRPYQTRCITSSLLYIHVCCRVCHRFSVANTHKEGRNDNPYAVYRRTVYVRCIYYIDCAQTVRSMINTMIIDISNQMDDIFFYHSFPDDGQRILEKIWFCHFIFFFLFFDMKKWLRDQIQFHCI